MSYNIYFLNIYYLCVCVVKFDSFGIDSPLSFGNEDIITVPFFILNFTGFDKILDLNLQILWCFCMSLFYCIKFYQMDFNSSEKYSQGIPLV